MNSIRLVPIAQLIAIALNPQTVGKIDHPMQGRCSWFEVNGRAAINAKPGQMYAAMRWNYADLAQHLGCEFHEIKNALSRCTVLVRNPTNGKTVRCKVADWGPAQHTGRMIDLSRAAISALEAETDDVLEATLTKESLALGAEKPRWGEPHKTQRE